MAARSLLPGFEQLRSARDGVGPVSHDTCIYMRDGVVRGVARLPPWRAHPAATVSKQPGAGLPARLAGVSALAPAGPASLGNPEDAAEMGVSGFAMRLLLTPLWDQGCPGDRVTSRLSRQRTEWAPSSPRGAARADLYQCALCRRGRALRPGRYTALVTDDGRQFTQDSDGQKEE